MNAPTAPTTLAPQLQQLKLDELVPSSTRVQALRRARFTDAELDELAASLRTQGVLQPLVARPRRDLGPFHAEIVAGERRYLAARRAGLEAVPVVVRPYTDEEVLSAQLVENLQRKGLDPLEEAEGYRELMALRGLKPDDLVGVTGKSRSWVYSRLKLLQLGDDAQRALAAGKLDASRALIVSRFTGKMQKKALELATQRTWQDTDWVHSVRSLEEALARTQLTRPLAGASFNLEDTSYFRLVAEPGKRKADWPEALPACTSCPQRSINCDPEARADVCTDAACFDRKTEQAHEARVAALRAAGRTVIDGSEAGQIFPGRYEHARGYLDLAEETGGGAPGYPERAADESDEAYAARVRAYQYSPPPAPTYRDQLDIDALRDEVVYVVHPFTGKMHELLPAPAAKKALKAAKLDVPWSLEPRDGRDAGADQAQHQKQLEAEKRKREIDAAWRVALAKAVFAKATAPLARTDLVAIAEILDDMADHDTLDELYGSEAPKPATLKDGDLARHLRLLLIADYVSPHRPIAPLVDMAKRLKIDPEKLKAKLRAEAKAGKKAAKK